MRKASPSFLDDEDSLARFLEAFDSGTLSRTEWTHAAHVAVAGSFYLAHTADQALARIREGIQRYNASQGIANTPTSGYHETLTCFWAAIVEQCLGMSNPQLPRIERIRFLVAELGDQRDLHRQYYGFNVVASREARAHWVAPDLSALVYPLSAASAGREAAT